MHTGAKGLNTVVHTGAKGINTVVRGGAKGINTAVRTGAGSIGDSFNFVKNATVGLAKKVVGRHGSGDGEDV